MSEQDDDAALQDALSGRHHSLKCIRTNIFYFHSQYNRLQIIHIKLLVNILNLKTVVVHNEAVNMPKSLYIIALDGDNS